MAFSAESERPAARNIFDVAGPAEPAPSAAGGQGPSIFAGPAATSTLPTPPRRRAWHGPTVRLAWPLRLRWTALGVVCLAVAGAVAIGIGHRERAQQTAQPLGRLPAWPSVDAPRRTPKDRFEPVRTPGRGLRRPGLTASLTPERPRGGRRRDGADRNRPHPARPSLSRSAPPTKPPATTGSATAVPVPPPAGPAVPPVTSDGRVPLPVAPGAPPEFM